MEVVDMELLSGILVAGLGGTSAVALSWPGVTLCGENPQNQTIVGRNAKNDGGLSE